MKLENKLKNRNQKQQNVAKKQRKEQKRLRQAVTGAILRTPRPLETYKKRPGRGRGAGKGCSQLLPCINCFSPALTEEEEEEDFLETLPMDMMEDNDLQQMTAMARQASFLTRDLSSW